MIVSTDENGANMEFHAVPCNLCESRDIAMQIPNQKSLLSHLFSENHYSNQYIFIWCNACCKREIAWPCNKSQLTTTESTNAILQQAIDCWNQNNGFVVPEPQTSYNFDKQFRNLLEELAHE